MSRACTVWARVLVAWTALCFAPSCSEAPTVQTGKTADPGAPDIILITIDTLRADRLGSYGYGRDTSPFIDSLAATGVRFENTYSTSSWTVPSMVSLMTSTYPDVHGVVHGVIASGAVEYQEAIPEELVQLPQVLKAAGYATFGVSANKHLEPGFGFGRGLDQYRCVGFARTTSVFPVLEQWVESLDSAAPYFLWIHLFDPHSPYLKQEPQFSRYWGDRPNRPELVGLSPARRYGRLEVPLDDEGADFVSALYDSEIRHTDDQLKKILEIIPRSKDAALIFTSDHGEEFGDHRGYGHGRHLFNEVIRVPMILRLPDKRLAGQVVKTNISLIDVAPTLAGLAGGQVPAGWEGRDLRGIAEAPPSSPRLVYSFLSRGKELRTVIGSPHKFTYNLRRPKRSRFVDLLADPQEHTDRTAAQPAAQARLRDRLIDRLISLDSTTKRPRLAPISDGHREQLQTLGYLE
jgi:arylsulfatase A-like enzyme